MGAATQSVDWSWEAPMAAAGDIPATVFLGLVITIIHHAAFVPWDPVRKNLKNAMGGVFHEKKVLRGVRMRWRGKIPLEATVRRRKVLHALTAVPNLGKVHIRGRALEQQPTPDSSRPDWMDTSARFGR